MKPTPIILGHLTCLQIAPPEMVILAARCGYDFVGLRLLPAYQGGAAYPMWNDEEMFAQLKRNVRDTGVGVFDIELIRIDEALNVEDLDFVFAMASELGAKSVLALGFDENRSRLVEKLAHVCDLAAKYSLKVDLEFLPWSEVKTIGEAAQIVKQTGRQNAGVLVDVIHVRGSGATLDQIAAIPADAINYMHLCDVADTVPNTLAAMRNASLHEREIPGQGSMDLTGILSALPFGTPLCVEVANRRLADSIGLEEIAKQSLVAARKLANAVGNAKI